MSRLSSEQALNAAMRDTDSTVDSSLRAKSIFTKVAAKISAANIPFRVISVCMIVMLLWAGSYKMTAPGAEGIAPLVENSPLIWWQFKVFGPYVGSDLIGVVEWIAAISMIAGYFRPKAGIVGGLIATVMFFTTSTMVVTTPGAIISVPGIHGMRYLSFLGLFLFKDLISLGASFYLIAHFGRRALILENSGQDSNQTTL
jgi:uncharacterized membrane protein YkgB